MARNKIAANTKAFKLLDDYCLVRDEPIANADTPRWISTTSRDREFLVNATLIEQLSLSASVKIARFDLSQRAYFVTVGPDTHEPPDLLTVEDINGGLLTAFLAELGPKPVAMPSEVRNIVEFADKLSTEGYDGHDPFSIASLFPKTQVFSAEDLLLEQSLRIFFLICLADRRCIDQWTDNQLSNTLVSLSDLSPDSVPFATLCRLLLEMDPGGLYLALYHCLEAPYAHAQTRELMTALGIDKNWVEMAETLEATLGWHPREEPSLEVLLRSAIPENLRNIAAALNEPIPPDLKEAPFIAKRIYRLRNVLVHYRPFRRKVSVESVDWNRLCEAMANLVRQVHQTCFPV